MTLISAEKLENLETNQPLDFGNALYLLSIGKKVRRLGWTRPGDFLFLKKEMSVVDYKPHFEDSVGDRYDMETEDILAEDWMIVK